MAQTHYAQILDASDDDQDADDDLRWATTPLEMRKGIFRMHVRPKLASSEGHGGCLFHVLTESGDRLAFFLQGDGEGSEDGAYVRVNDDILVSQPCSWDALQELTLTFDARAGSVTVEGATTGNGTAVGDKWHFPDGVLRIGNTDGAGDCIRGYVSLPYAVTGEAPAVTVAAPTITSITPNTSNLGGGDAATIVGTGFAEGSFVRVDGDLAEDIVVVSATEITITVPSGSGVVDIVVENADGTGTLVDGLTYADPENAVRIDGDLVRVDTDYVVSTP